MVADTIIRGQNRAGQMIFARRLGVRGFMMGCIDGTSAKIMPALTDGEQTRIPHNLLSLNFFSLSSQKKILEHETTITTVDGVKRDVHVIIEASQSTSVPQIADRDLIQFLAIEAWKRYHDTSLTEEERKSREFTFTVSDYLKATNRSICAKSYKILQDTIDRLSSALIKTDLAATAELDPVRGYFRWFQDGTAMQLSKKTGRLQRVRIVLGEWLYNALIEDASSLRKIPPSFYDMRPIERRIFDIVFSILHEHQRGPYSVDFNLFHKMMGAETRPRVLFDRLKRIATEDVTAHGGKGVVEFPLYRLAIFDDREVMTAKEALARFGDGSAVSGLFLEDEDKPRLKDVTLLWSRRDPYEPAPGVMSSQGETDFVQPYPTLLPSKMTVVSDEPVMESVNALD